MNKKEEFELANDARTKARSREVQLLINLAEPDPAFQPLFLSDDASLLDAVGTNPDTIRDRITAHLGITGEVDVTMPVWRLVDRIKELVPQWPDDDGQVAG